MRLFRDRFPTHRIKGVLVIELFDRNGRIIKTIKGGNLIVKQARTTLIHLIAGDAPEGYYVSKLVLGGGGHDPNDPNIAIPPSLSDTGLVKPYDGYNDGVKEVTYVFPDGPEGTKVEFNAVIPLNSDLNGLPISEYGLFTANNKLFSRKTTGAITKSGSFGMKFRWIISF